MRHESDNKKFWKTVKSLFTNNIKTRSRLTLTEKKKVSTKEASIVIEK